MQPVLSCESEEGKAGLMVSSCLSHTISPPLLFSLSLPHNMLVNQKGFIYAKSSASQKLERSFTLQSLSLWSNEMQSEETPLDRQSDENYIAITDHFEFSLAFLLASSKKWFYSFFIHFHIKYFLKCNISALMRAFAQLTSNGMNKNSWKFNMWNISNLNISETVLKSLFIL